MSEFLTVLALYYTCDAMVQHRPLSLTPSQLATCMGYYEAVKSEFADAEAFRDPAASRAQSRAAYAAFKAWEAENETLVGIMRQNALAAVRRN